MCPQPSSALESCGLIFLHPDQRVPPAQEKARYDTHNNNPAEHSDDGYVQFLQRLTQQIVPLLAPGARGLDFGCGPQPVLSELMQQSGFAMHNYDPFYVPHTGENPVLDSTYDFITMSEVAEHLYNPLASFQKVTNMLTAGGLLGVMTEMVISSDRFANWWYHRDITHVCFYGQGTMQWIARTYDLEVHFPAKNVTIFYK